jgi:hypothetical protein
MRHRALFMVPIYRGQGQSRHADTCGRDKGSGNLPCARGTLDRVDGMSDRAGSFIVLARRDIDLAKLVSAKDPGKRCFSSAAGSGEPCKSSAHMRGRTRTRRRRVGRSFREPSALTKTRISRGLRGRGNRCRREATDGSEMNDLFVGMRKARILIPDHTPLSLLAMVGPKALDWGYLCQARRYG